MDISHILSRDVILVSSERILLIDLEGFNVFFYFFLSFWLLYFLPLNIISLSEEISSPLLASFPSGAPAFPGLLPGSHLLPGRPALLFCSGLRDVS